MEVFTISEKNIPGDKSREADIKNRFNYHKPDEQAMATHQAVRDVIREAAVDIDVLVPEGREKSLALTNLEQAMFWANAGIARQNPDGSRK